MLIALKPNPSKKYQLWDSHIYFHRLFQEAYIPSFRHNQNNQMAQEMLSQSRILWDYIYHLIIYFLILYLYDKHYSHDNIVNLLIFFGILFYYEVHLSLFSIINIIENISIRIIFHNKIFRYFLFTFISNYFPFSGFDNVYNIWIFILLEFI